MSTLTAAAGAAANESPGLLGDIDQLFDTFQEVTSIAVTAPAAPAAPAAPVVQQSYWDHTNNTTNDLLILGSFPSFDESLTVDPTVAELARRLLGDAEAIAHAKRLVKASKHAAVASTNGNGHHGGAPGAPKRRRKPKQEVPEHMKDAKYFRKRAANTEAARRTRERAKVQKRLRTVAAATAAAAKAQLNALMMAR